MTVRALAFVLVLGLVAVGVGLVPTAAATHSCAFDPCFHPWNVKEDVYVAKCLVQLVLGDPCWESPVWP